MLSSLLRRNFASLSPGPSSFAALVIGGLFTILIVLSRTPYFQEIIPWVDFFKTALVVHVNLTVLVWFLAFTGVLWSYTSSSRGLRTGWLHFHWPVSAP